MVYCGVDGFFYILAVEMMLRLGNTVNHIEKVMIALKLFSGATENHGVLLQILGPQGQSKHTYTCFMM